MIIWLLQLYVIWKTVITEVLLSIIKFVTPIGWYPRKDITGQTIILTGAANGIGRRLAQKLASLNVNLILWDIDEKNLERTRLLCQHPGSQIRKTVVDVTKEHIVESALQKVILEFEVVDILINNAGIASFHRFVDLSKERLRAQIDINFIAPLMLTRAVLPGMIARNRGHIVATASSRALVGKGMIADYSAEKQGVAGLMEALEDEMTILGKRGIRFTTVCPLLTKTNLTKPLGNRLALLSPEIVSQYYLDAILCEKRIAVVPRRAIYAFWLKSFLPSPVYQLFT